jgi:hypothetical protein
MDWKRFQTIIFGLLLQAEQARSQNATATKNLLRPEVMDMVVLGVNVSGLLGDTQTAANFAALHPIPVRTVVCDANHTCQTVISHTGGLFVKGTLLTDVICVQLGVISRCSVHYCLNLRSIYRISQNQT